MEQLKGLPLGRQLVLGAGVLLLIDTFLPWQSVGPFSANAWHGFWGIVLSLLTIVLVAWTAARAFGIEIPVNLPDDLTTLGVSAVILLFAVIKALADSYSAWGSYVGILLAAVVAYGAWFVFKESGESLPNMSTGGASTASSPPPPPESAPDATPGNDLP
jgi:hypothetical protein